MKILLLSHSAPAWPGNGYELRLYYLTKLLSTRHEVGLFYYRKRGDKEADSPTSCDPVYSLPWPSGTSHNGRKRPGIMPWRRWPDVSAYYDAPALELVREIVAKHRFDVIWASGWRMPLLAHWADCGIPVFGDFVDEDVGEGFRRLLRMQSPKEFILNSRSFLHSFLFERRYFALPDMCHLVSDHEAKLVQRLFPQIKIVSVANGVDCTYFQPEECQDEPHTIVFEGDMSFGNNQDGALWFAMNVLPKVRKRFPNVVFRLVGRNPTEKLLALRSDSVEVTGAVNDVRPYLARATLLVCPLLNGAGVKNKILQAWAMAKAVVATPVACMGLHAEDKHNILIHKSPKGFAGGVCELIQNPAERKRIATAARATIEQFYSWELKAQEFEKLLLQLVHDGAARRRMPKRQQSHSHCDGEGGR